MGYGFLGDDSAADLNSTTNNGVTGFGGLDAMAKAGKSGKGLPGGGVLGHVGGVLSALGLANDAVDIDKRGLNGENGLSAAGNTLGLGSYVAGLIGGAANPAGWVMGAGAAGMALGAGSNNHIAKKGTLGKNVDGTNRNWSDMSADWGTAAEDGVESLVGDGYLGAAAGVGATVAGSVVGTAATVANIPEIGADMALDVGAAGIDAAGDLWDYAWS